MRWILFKLGAGWVLVKRTTYYRRVEDVYVDDKQFDTSAHVGVAHFGVLLGRQGRRKMIFPDVPMHGMASRLGVFD